MDKHDKAILTRVSAAFPLVPRPYALLAGELGLSEDEVIARVRALKGGGTIRRIGATIDPRAVAWYSTLCAVNVPESRIEEYAQVVNAFEEVTHNYVRSGVPNCWFTIIAPDKARADEIMGLIRSALDLPVLELPATRVFKIGVRFSLSDD
ncbi:MAG: AsnC family transcriptional regulator [Syntrophaceae bacterium]